MKTLYLIRHGKTEANEKRFYCGSMDLPLSGTGRQELDALRPAYELLVPRDAVLFGSGMMRTEETLSILFGRRADSVRPDLREADFGSFEGFSHQQLLEREDYRAWLEGDNYSNLCPGGESGSIMRERVLRGLRSVLEKEWEQAVVCSHGGPIGAVMEFLFPGVYAYWYSWQPEPGRGWRIRLEEQGGARDVQALP